jgi:uncharacterized paraquat-inducible protein A
LSEDFEIEIHCPECDSELEVRLGQIKRLETIICPRCKTNIQMQPDGTPNATETQTMEDSFASIRQAIDNLQKPQA